ncbi:MAG: hypothetical protein KKB81_03220 [Candidatus Margulisbacteria bacterium]|nr:hypothetical protein [Candidatus Margulisiibacteriota bacterium]MBU1022256.1 hypothetical protein [Candidatus Margulisiibacteriota bacterium]MBU1729305.1 hypothetical protein [Candidatus Margulisiibacteriota bacterium]MBU1955578.1 hypothetical protein [Candidatus Margulisiibacteriota bacterium]
MKKLALAAIILLLVGITFISVRSLFTHPKTYVVTEIIKGADFDYEMIKNIDSIPPPYPPDSSYQIGDIKTKEGNFVVYKLISKYRGRSKFSSRPVPLHDLLVLKVDDDEKIIDAFHYTLEWTDSPSLDLYKLNNSNAYLKNGMDIAGLDLINVNDGKKLEENAILDLKSKN